MVSSEGSKVGMDGRCSRMNAAPEPWHRRPQARLHETRCGPARPWLERASAKLTSPIHPRSLSAPCRFSVLCRTCFLQVLAGLAPSFHVSCHCFRPPRRDI